MAGFESGALAYGNRFSNHLAGVAPQNLIMPAPKPICIMRPAPVRPGIGQEQIFGLELFEVVSNVRPAPELNSIA